MKLKKVISIFACSFLLAGGGLLVAQNAPEFKEAKAANVDVGQISFIVNGDSARAAFTNGIFLEGDRDNDIVVNWDVSMTNANSESCKLNGVGFSCPLKKIPDYTNGYYLALSDVGHGNRTVGDKVELEGVWTKQSGDDVQTLTVNKFSATWNGTKWVDGEEGLEFYDKVSLAQAGFDDYNQVAIDEERAPFVANTFALSDENTTSSFAFEFLYEAYGEKIDKTLDIRIGNSAAWVTGHHYQLALNNSWGPDGVIALFEKDGDTILKSSGDFNCNLQAGARHTIEFGSIYFKNSTSTFNYIKYDGTIGKYFINVPPSHDRTTRVGLYLPGTNMFVGSSIPQKEANYVLNFDRSNENKGIY